MDTTRAVEMLESLGAEHLADRTYGTLSEGERKRVLIARALMTDPELLLLDEPAAGLDLGGREELVARLTDLAADPDAPATVLITHHVEEIPPGFTHALLLKEGEVVAQGLIDDVITAENLSQRVQSVDQPGQGRRSVLRAAHPRCPGSTAAEAPAGGHFEPRELRCVALNVRTWPLLSTPRSSPEGRLHRHPGARRRVRARGVPAPPRAAGWPSPAA